MGIDWNALWWWLADPSVWEWLRPTGAALLGAILGGLFTLWGQRWASRAQLQRDTEQWQRQEESAQREKARDDARGLFEDFTLLRRNLERRTSQLWDSAMRDTAWRETWSPDVSLAVDVRSRLIPDATVRTQLQQLVRILDNAHDITYGGGERYPFQIDGALPIVGLEVASEGIELMGAYLRGERFVSQQTESLGRAIQAIAELEQWMEEVIRDEAEDYLSGRP